MVRYSGVAINGLDWIGSIHQLVNLVLGGVRSGVRGGLLLFGHFISGRIMPTALVYTPWPFCRGVSMVSQLINDCIFLAFRVPTLTMTRLQGKLGYPGCIDKKRTWSISYSITRTPSNSRLSYPSLKQEETPLLVSLSECFQAPPYPQQSNPFKAKQNAKEPRNLEIYVDVQLWRRA